MALLTLWLFLLMGLTLARPSVPEDIQYENITIYATDDRIDYYPPCSAKSHPECQASWWKIHDDRFSNGVAMMAGHQGEFAHHEPYMRLRFKGEEYNYGVFLIC